MAAVVPWLTGWHPFLTPLAAGVLVVWNLIQLLTRFGRQFFLNLVILSILALPIAVFRFMEL